MLKRIEQMQFEVRQLIQGKVKGEIIDVVCEHLQKKYSDGEREQTMNLQQLIQKFREKLEKDQFLQLILQKDNGVFEGKKLSKDLC